MKRTFRPGLERLETRDTPSSIAPPAGPSQVDPGNATSSTVQAALAAGNFGISLAFLITPPQAFHG